MKSRPVPGGSNNPMSIALNTMFKPKLSATGGTNLYEELGVSQVLAMSKNCHLASQVN